MRPLLALACATALAAGCGGGAEPEPVASEELASVPVLGGGRLVLVAGRSEAGPLCVAARLEPDGNTTPFHCLDDNDPVRVFVAVGGRTGRHIDRESIVGLVREDVGRVTIFGEPERLRLRRVDGIAWRAFTAGPFDGRGRHFSEIAVPTGIEVHAVDGALLDDVQLSWAFQPPCGSAADQCGPPWATPVDATAADTHPGLSAEQAGEAEEIALADEAVQDTVAGNPYVVDNIMNWSRCDGERIGAVLTIRFLRPVSVDGEFPFSWFDEQNDSAYVAGRYRLGADGVTELMVFVDADAGAVVGIQTMGDEVRVRHREVIAGPRPGGAPDDTEDC